MKLSAKIPTKGLKNSVVLFVFVTVLGACSLYPFRVPIKTQPRSDVDRKALPTKTDPYIVHGKTYYPLKSARGYDAVGIASWYGSKFHGRKTASGQVYNMYALTAAHKTLPLGTKVKVTNLANNHSVYLLINDRGPFVPGRVLDISFAAARKIKMVEAGLAQVRIQALE